MKEKQIRLKVKSVEGSPHVVQQKVRTTRIEWRLWMSNEKDDESMMYNWLFSMWTVERMNTFYIYENSCVYIVYILLFSTFEIILETMII